TDREAPWRINDAYGAQHVLEIRKRFAHPHEDHVVDLLCSLTLNRDDLVNNLVCAQVARKTLQTTCKKFEAVGAAYLGRDADRLPVRPCSVKRMRRRNQNRFDQTSVGQTK